MRREPATMRADAGTDWSLTGNLSFVESAAPGNKGSKPTLIRRQYPSGFVGR